MTSRCSANWLAHRAAHRRAGSNTVHHTGHGILLFFSRDIRPEKAVAELPADRRVEETPTGMLVVKLAA